MRNHCALSFGVRFRVLKSTFTSPKRLPKPSIHSKLSNQALLKVAIDRHAVGGRPLELGEIGGQEHEPVGVVHPTVLGYTSDAAQPYSVMKIDFAPRIDSWCGAQ